jgi:hypothetical protein
LYNRTFHTNPTKRKHFLPQFVLININHCTAEVHLPPSISPHASFNGFTP